MLSPPRIGGDGQVLQRSQSELLKSATMRFLESSHFEAWAGQQNHRLPHQPSLAVAGNDALPRFEDRTDPGLYRLTKKEKIYLTRKAKESALALIEHAHTLDGPVQWHYKGKHRGIQMYRGEGLLDENCSGPVEFLCGVTTMMGTLKEVSDYFDQGTTARMRMKKAEDVMDCAVLYSLISGNTVNPYHRVAVKYSAFSGHLAFARNRDFCYLECQDTFRHASGRRGWVLSMHSIKLPSCPEIQGFVRGSMYNSGYVFVESERPGYMDVMHSLQLNFRGSYQLPQFLTTMALKRRLRELIHISREIQVARIAHRTLLKERDLMPKHLRSSCGGCARKFWLFVRKTRCRVCGEVFCQTCAPEMEWEGPGSIGPIKTRVCLQCCNAVPMSGVWATHERANEPWTEATRRQQNRKAPMPAYDDLTRSFNILRTPAKRRSSQNDIMDDDDDDDEEGRYTFAELEEASSRSVFAPERFTGSSNASSCMPYRVGTGENERHHRYSDELPWQARATDDSLFDSNSMMSTDSYFGRRETAMGSAKFIKGESPLMGRPGGHHQGGRANRVSRRERRNSRASSRTADALVDAPLPRPGQVRLPGSHELSSSMLLAHERSFMRVSDRDNDQRPRSRSSANAPRVSGVGSEGQSTIVGPVALDDIVPAESFDASTKLSGAEGTPGYRPSSLILKQLQKRKARARTIVLQTMVDSGRGTEEMKTMEEDHNARMDELNDQAVELTGNRISAIKPRTRLAQEPTDDKSWRNSEAMEQYYARRKNTIEALRMKAMQIADSSRESSGTDKTAASSRSPSFMSQRLTGRRSDPPAEDSTNTTLNDSQQQTTRTFLQMPIDPSEDTFDSFEHESYGRRTDSSEDAIAQKYLSMRSDAAPEAAMATRRSTRSSKSSKSSSASMRSSKHSARRSSIERADPAAASPFQDESNDFENYDSSNGMAAMRSSSTLVDPALMHALTEEQRQQKMQPPVHRLPPTHRMQSQAQQAPSIPQPAPAPAAAGDSRVSMRTLYREIGNLSQLQSAAAAPARNSEHERIKDQIREQYKLIRALQIKE